MDVRGACVDVGRPRVVAWRPMKQKPRYIPIVAGSGQPPPSQSVQAKVSRRLLLRRDRPSLVKRTVGLSLLQLDELQRITRASGAYRGSRDVFELVRIAVDIVIEAHPAKAVRL